MAAPRRAKRLHVLRKHVDNEPEPMWMPREGLPAGGRDECRHGERPCPYVHCEWHLWMIDTKDRNGRNMVTGGRPGSTLKPRWLEYPTPPCCGLDIAELMRDHRSRVIPIHLIAYALDVTEDWMRQVIDRAMAKIAPAARELFDKLEVEGDEEFRTGASGTALRTKPRSPFK